MKTKTRKNGFTLVELLVVIAIIGILIGMLLPAVQAVREASRRIACASNMRQMSIGMLNYESANGHFPPGIIGDNRATNGINWSAIILPFVEQEALFDRLQQQTDNFTTFRSTNQNFPTIWTDENGDTATEILPIYHCPSDEMGDVNPVRPSSGFGFFDCHGKSNYVGVIGPRAQGNTLTIGSENSPNIDDLNKIFTDRSGPIPGESDFDRNEALFEIELPGMLFINSEVSFGEVADGASNTFLIGERDGGFIEDGEQRGAAVWCGANNSIWFSNCLGPTDDNTEFTLNSVSTEFGSRNVAFSSLHPGGANFGRADGSIEFVSETINPDLYLGMGTKAGGEVLIE